MSVAQIPQYGGGRAFNEDVDEKTFRHRERGSKSSRNRQIREADIGPPPAIVDTGRREEGRNSLLRFFEIYQSGRFVLNFSDVHIQMIHEIEDVVLNGGKSVFILPRGSGKSTILLFTVEWVALYGFRRFPFLAPGDGSAAPEMIKALQDDLCTNELLLEDFPEVCYPFQRTDGMAARANFQTSRGEPTYIKLGKIIRFPMMEENRAKGNAGIIIKAKGFLGSVRGQNAHWDGETIRPDLYLVDDPQTLKSAYSEIETRKRSKIIRGDLIKGAGPGQVPAVFGAATIIRHGDLAHQWCDPKQFRGWKVTKVSFLTQWPDHMDLWIKYSQLRSQALENERDPIEANEFYVANRETMDLGGVTYWPDRIDPGSISALQSAMNRWIDDPESFFSEDQNAPAAEDEAKGLDDTLVFTLDNLKESVGGLARGVVPSDSSAIVSFVDVSANVLWWMTCSINSDFNVHIMDYGTHPDNGVYTTRTTINTSLLAVYGDSIDNGIEKGIGRLMDEITERQYVTSDGQSMAFTGGMVDSKWGVKANLVRNAVWKHRHSGLWLPYEGIGLTAANKRLNDVTRPLEPREVRGHDWRLSANKGGMRAMADSNSWKAFAAQAIREGRLSIFSGDNYIHRMLFDQLLAEYSVRTESKDRVVSVFKRQLTANDEHLWDCFYACCVRGSIAGVSMVGQQLVKTKSARTRLSIRDRKR